MRYGSVCSGIEAATVAWHGLGWEPAFFSEIEKFPREVLAHHYPDVPLHGDFTTIEENQYGSIDLLVGGTPCQSFSVAGLRKGLDDDRGNLSLEFIKLAQRARPRWVVWENVPGVLSSNGGRDFGSFLSALGQSGYGFAYRVLDAQYFGVAQRRRRVFVVGYFGDWRRAAAVLFERESLRGNPAPSREKGQKPAPTVTAGPPFSRTGNDRVECDAYVSQIVGPLTRASNAGGTVTHQDISAQHLVTARMQADCDAYIPSVAGSLCARTGLSMSLQDASQDHFVTARMLPECNAYIPEVANTLQTTANDYSRADGFNAIALAENTIGRKPMNGGNGDGFTEGGPMYTLNATGVHGVAAFQQNTRDEVRYIGGDGKIAGALAASAGMKQTNYIQIANHNMAVRRLTPTECERLQGFPDGYTNIKDKCPDGPRYKALGNSMAVPVMKWIGERIQMVENYG
jgi:DNA (cytosine-5)-methyltransferase 1